MPCRPRMMPPVGKSGPGTMAIRSSIDSPGLSISAMQASITSPRLCGGMLVAMPTAMPPAPLTRRLGKARRQHHRLALGIVVVGLEIDGVLVEILDQRAGDALQPHLGVAHGRRRIAVDRAEIALSVDQRQAHGEILRHAHQRVVDRLVAVRMIFADHVADDARGFPVRLVPFVAVFVHRIEDAPMHRLEPVARVRQRARHDHAHGVIEVALLHLLGDGDRTNIGGAALCRRRVILVCQDEFLRRICCDFHSRSGAAAPPLSAPGMYGFPLEFQCSNRCRASFP